MQMTRAPLLLAILCLTACVGANPETEGGIIETTDEMSLASTGFPVAAVASERLAQQDDGSTLSAVQYDTALATPAMIAAAPAALCAGVGLGLVSSRNIAPPPDYIDSPGSMVIEATCK
jgi:hypothetical protein